MFAVRRYDDKHRGGAIFGLRANRARQTIQSNMHVPRT